MNFEYLPPYYGRLLDLSLSAENYFPYLNGLKRNDLILVDQTCSSYYLTRQDDDRFHAFLVQADAKGIKWLYYLSYSRRREELYMGYYRHIVRE
jgi:hypothetical protein